MSTSKKTLRTDKTIVTDFKIQVVDIHLRLKNMAGAQAVHLPEGVNMSSGDFNITDTQPLKLHNVRSMVAIHSFEPFRLSFSTMFGEIKDVHCNGLFVMYGELDSLEVTPHELGHTTRLSYIYA